MSKDEGANFRALGWVIYETIRRQKAGKPTVILTPFDGECQLSWDETGFHLTAAPGVLSWMEIFAERGE